ncbi:hypothetical protein [uncultured Enterovirga sp.]|uniref:hypothetical protein n=1 Tax=uncultured Enterovirga sp. TaxID=2026352 RepID=UPI0035CAFF56
MLAEALLHLTAKSSAELRALGLVGDAVGLWSRATRRRKAWSPHEQRSCAFVRSFAESLARHRTLLVLGSGLIRDVPLAFLAATFERTILVDAVHLWPARLRAGRVRAETRVADLTGFAASLSGEEAGRVAPLAALQADPAIDLVVSANLLSQLPMAPARWLDRRPEAARRWPADLGRVIQEGHLADLAGFGAPVCLLSDVSYRDVARGGDVAQGETALVKCALPAPDEVWDWEVAPPGEIDRGFRRIHRVHAWRDIRGRAG